jgi:nicotinamidase-related amidase
VAARPYPYSLPLASTAVIMIDFQKDFMLKGGFGDTLKNDVGLLMVGGPGGLTGRSLRRDGWRNPFLPKDSTTVENAAESVSNTQSVEPPRCRSFSISRSHPWLHTSLFDCDRSANSACPAISTAHSRSCSPSPACPQECVPGAQRLLAVARAAKLPIVHTLEAHKPDLSDLHTSKLTRGNLPEELRIGATGAMGRILVAGEEGEPGRVRLRVPVGVGNSVMVC